MTMNYICAFARTSTASSRKPSCALSAVEETPLLRSKAKEMGATRVTDAADVDERVAKLAEGRDKLVKELNETTMELERMDSEIEKRQARRRRLEEKSPTSRRDSPPPTHKTRA